MEVDDAGIPRNQVQLRINTIVESCFIYSVYQSTLVCATPKCVINMKRIIALVFIVTNVCGRPQNGQTGLSWYENANDGRGNFKYAFQTNNEVKQQSRVLPEVPRVKTNYLNLRGFYAFLVPAATRLSLLPLTVSKSDVANLRSIDSHPGNRIGVHFKQYKDAPDTATGASQVQTVLVPILVNAPSPAPGQNKSSTAEEEFPDRIGSPTIITLQGSWG